MYEILRNLPSGSRILDLGVLIGSFPLECVSHCLVARIPCREIARTRQDQGSSRLSRAATL